MLTKWIDPAESSKLPGFASHYVGVGGLVFSKDRKRLLCIKELRGPYKMWKLPGGLVETGESIEEAVKREVWEETGVKTSFTSVLGVRELVKSSLFGQPDLYFVCMLEAESEQIAIQSENEIAEAGWIELVST